MATLNNSYIIKLLTLLVKRNKGPIRVPAPELMDSDVGQGIRVWWDDSSRELVIDHMPRGATVYSIGDNQTWLANQLPQEPISIPRPKSTEDLIAKAWTDSAATPTTQELASQRRSRVVHVDDESIVSAETEQRKRELLKQIESYQSPNPTTTRIPSSNRTTFFKQ